MENRYTLLDLIAFQTRHDYGHTVTMADLEKVNALVKMIESNPDGVMARGDVILINDEAETNPTYIGRVDTAGLSTGFERDSGLSYCERPYVPFIFLDGSFSMSGGSFGRIKPEHLRYVGKTPALFKTWAHMGAVARGAIYFIASVNKWEYDRPRGN